MLLQAWLVATVPIVAIAGFLTLQVLPRVQRHGLVAELSAGMALWSTVALLAFALLLRDSGALSSSDAAWLYVLFVASYALVGFIFALVR